MTEQMLELLKNGGAGMMELAKTGSTVLVDEVIRLYIFFGIMGVLKASVVFIILFVLNKFLTTIQDVDNIRFVKAGKVSLLVLSMVYFTMNAFPHLSDMGKALVAPNLFLIEKGVDLVKKDK